MRKVLFLSKWRGWVIGLIALAVIQVPLTLAGAPWATTARLAAFALCLALALFLYFQVRRQEYLYCILQDISRELMAQSEIGNLLDHIVQATAELIPATEKCVIHFLDPQGRRLYPRHVSRADRGRMIGMPADSGIAGRALQTRETILVRDVRREPGFLPLQSDPDLRSLLVAPLYVGEERLGTLSLNSNKPYAFTEQDRILVTLLAMEASAALYQHRLLDASHQEHEHSELILNSLTDAVVVLDEEHRILRYNPALATILGPDLIGLTGRRVQLQSPDSRLQRLAYLIGDWETETPLRRRITIEEPVHAVLDIDISPVRDEDGRWLRIITMHDITATADALADQTRFLRATAHGLQAPLAELASAKSKREFTKALHLLERLRQDLLALAEPMEALAYDPEPPIPLRALLERLSFELEPPLRDAFEIRLPSALALKRVPGRWLGHLLLSLVEETFAQTGASKVILEIEGEAEEIAFTIIGVGAIATSQPHQENALGFGVSPMGLSLEVAQRLAEALGGHLWTEPHSLRRHLLSLPLHPSAD